MEFIFVWALMTLALAYIAFNIWLVLDSLYERVIKTHFGEHKPKKTKPHAPTNLSPLGS